MVAFKPYRSSDMSDDIDFDEDLTTPDAWFSDYNDDSKEDVFIASVNLDMKPFEWLTFRLKGGVNYRNKEL